MTEITEDDLRSLRALAGKRHDWSPAAIGRVLLALVERTDVLAGHGAPLPDETIAAWRDGARADIDDVAAQRVEDALGTMQRGPASPPPPRQPLGFFKWQRLAPIPDAEGKVLRAEIARLRRLVESAYREAWRSPVSDGASTPMPWPSSDARAALGPDLSVESMQPAKGAL